MPAPSNRREWFWIYFCGFCMGSADIVPGISGATVALILGIYEQLIKSINTIRFHLKKIAWGFLSAILLGIVTAFVFLASLISHILNHEVYRTFL